MCRALLPGLPTEDVINLLLGLELCSLSWPQIQWLCSIVNCFRFNAFFSPDRQWMTT
jgi:hypothetical protein